MSLRQSLVRSLARTLAPVVDLVFPPRCPLCGEGISAQLGLCAACWSELAIPGEPCCTLCQRPFPDGVAAGAICAPCLVEPPRHDGIAAATLYNDASRHLVLSFKHGRRIALAPMMGRLMAARLPFVGDDWLVVPVPLHRWRLWRRGFNQSVLLGGEIAQSRSAQLMVDALERRKATPTLGGLGRKARARVLSGSIAINTSRADRLRGASIVLVDDVLTSGATSKACVHALKRAGAQRVVIACFARVLDEALPHTQ
jgi:ComF family protein